MRYGQGENPTAFARYTLAVDRRFKREGEPSADFINCVAFGRNAEFAEKYLAQGVKILVCGHIQTGSYTNRDGVKIYTTDVAVDEQEFAESKKTSTNGSQAAPAENRATAARESAGSDGFVNIPDGIDEELPFN